MTPKKTSVQVSNPDGTPRTHAEDDGRGVLWLDLDNCVYSKNSGVSEMMKELIGAYFRKLGLPEAEAKELHHHYYTEYGLAVRGLVRHHHIDPLDYDAQCDAALPLDKVLKPNPALQAMLSRIDRTKWRVWALTNAYVNHAVRLLDLLGLASQFEGVCSCDYGAGEFNCKPEPEYYAQALVAGGQPDPARNWFVDDSALNIKGAHKLGWGHVTLFDELGNERAKLGGIEGTDVGGKGKVTVIGDILELEQVWKEVFV